MKKLLHEIRNCTLCAEHLPLGPHPVLTAHPDAKILVVGQAPGTKVHNTGIPWNDQSGDRLRHWLQVSRDTFYDPTKFAIVPMGFCYPGKGKSGDLPPRPECAPTWHQKVLSELPNIELTLLIGQYAQRYYLKEKRYKTLAKTVKNYQDFLPEYIPTPHPSPRNTLWLRKNPWFELEVVPLLSERVQCLI
ncbi:uracil-DNA glycosylase family protein [Planktosalinus lacus]|uniref:IclR family transcriptional regulator n=1 Tax=Planktosalinus lacus TaxID=1526573 RepID=A0A8J2V856_9FLAO|nr:uracil-DNA glycosylase family protein [Planktosalinus lacus]GGD80660.1 IclR family transcriptional regulator [Planktosalinus lacus]